EPRRPPLSEFNEPMDAELWINFDEQVDVIRHDLHLDDLRSCFLGDLPDDSLEPFINAVDQYLASVFRAENHVVLAGTDNIVVVLVLHEGIIRSRAIESTPLDRIYCNWGCRGPSSPGLKAGAFGPHFGKGDGRRRGKKGFIHRSLE